MPPLPSPTVAPTATPVPGNPSAPVGSPCAGTLLWGLIPLALAGRLWGGGTEMKQTPTLALVTGILLTLSLTACASPPPPPTETLVPTPIQWMPPTAIPTLQSTPTPTSSPIPVPWPTLIPTVDPAVLPDLLGAAFTVQQESGVDGHTLRRVTGWEYGLRSSDYYGRPPYRWLDSTHLLLFPLVGEQEDEMFGAVELTLPVVVNLNLNRGAAWLPALDRDSYPKPIWSDALQVLIVAQEGEILLMV
jgi:hypothetical protein